MYRQKDQLFITNYQPYFIEGNLGKGSIEKYNTCRLGTFEPENVATISDLSLRINTTYRSPGSQPPILSCSVPPLLFCCGGLNKYV